MALPIGTLREHGSGVQVLNGRAARELQFINVIHRILSLLGLIRSR